MTRNLKSQIAVSLLASAIGVTIALSQQAGPTTGPGVQSTKDSKEPDVWKTCKVPPNQGKGGGGAFKGGGGPPKGGGGGKAPGGAAAAPKDPTAIPGVLADGQKWKDVWKVEGNNGDGIIGTDDGGILIAQNDNSKVVKLDKDGKLSDAYTGLNTSGSVAMNSKGALFVVNRGLNPSVWQLKPKKQPLATTFEGDPLDCIGTVMNDIVADSKGGVYFTMGSVFHSDAKGVVTKYGDMLNGLNGIILAPDEKHLIVTTGNTLTSFDVQADGSLTNQHEFAKLSAGGADGSTFDAAGRLYITEQGTGIEVLSPDGKSLGTIPTPRGVISVAFSGKDRKTLYAVSREGNTDWIITLQMLAQGAKGRGK